jgi:hypothetical protein
VVTALIEQDTPIGIDGYEPAYLTDWNDFAAFAPGASGSLTGNSDGDQSDDLLEFALGQAADSGAASTKGGFCVELAISGTVDAILTRPIGVSDVTYTLQTSTVLGNPTVWTPWPGAVPTPSDNGDGTETLTFADLETVVGVAGIARLQVDFDNGSITGQSFTPVFGWHSQTNTAACESCSFPYAVKSLFSGVSSTAGPSLTVSGTPVLGAGTHYIEILSGALEGHRFDVASVGNDNVTLDASSARNTLNPVPDLTGAPFALRPHATLATIAPPELFAADNDSNAGDRILAYSAGAWTTYWVFDMSGTMPKQWTDAADGDADDAGQTIVDITEGIFLHPKSGEVSLTMVGVARAWAVAGSLDGGFNLVGSTYPIDQSPEAREMFRDDSGEPGAIEGKDWFTASNDPLQADQLMFWLGDTIPAASGYETYFRLNLGVAAYDHWTYQGDSNLDDSGDDQLFMRGRAAFINLRTAHDRSDADAVWLMPAPWTTD